jgi:chromosome segregation ATPase
METNMILSMGSLLSVVGLFYSWHKDSKQSAGEMANLRARVNSLEEKAKQTDTVLQELLSSVQEIKVTLAKIDTKLTIMEKDINDLKEKKAS